MKIKIAATFLFAFGAIMISLGQTSGQTSANGGTIQWNSAPFDRKQFIENAGQFDDYAQNGDKILYGAEVGQFYTFITDHGIVYEYTEYIKSSYNTDEEQGDADKESTDLNPVKHYIYAAWQGAANNAVAIPTEEQSAYYSYIGKQGGIKARLFKRITCRNIYPGIDVEYVFPKDKDGIEYSYIVHPGADASLIKLKYSGDKVIMTCTPGDVDVKTDWGGITDHAPLVYYATDHKIVDSKYILNNNVESFSIGEVDHTKTLVIDPFVTNWTVNPAVLANSAWDVDYDYNGNVYSCGTTNMEIVKMNSLGTILWTFNGNTYFNQPGFFGGFAVDKVTGSVYIANGIPHQSPLGLAVIKTTNAGIYVTGINNTTLMYEYWRVRFDQCNNQIIIAGGGATGHNDVLRIDTNLAIPVYLNPYFPTSGLYQDLCGIAIDPTNTYCYMASASGDENTHNNHIIQMPMPTLAVTNWNVSDGFAFNELGILYGGLNDAMNCMCASMKFVYLYDGKTIKKYNPANGAILLTATMPGGTAFKWGGIDVDLCDNIYIGNGTNIYIYNSSLVQTGIISPVTNNTYDVKLGQREYSGYDSLLYVCGGNFISSIKLNFPAPGPNITKTRTIGCGCTSKAKATLNFCGSPDTATERYSWSNGQTTQTATGLCLGTTYTVTIYFGCTNKFTDTVKIPAACVLPIELESYTGKCENDYPLLQWTTATETNNDHFTLDRTRDNLLYETVGTVKGAGNSSSPHSYSMVDHDPFSGTSYYRLSQTDFDGTTEHVGIIEAPCENAESIKAFPVNGNTINVTINSSSGSAYKVTLTDMLGRTILTKDYQASRGLNEFKLAPHISGGIYILQINGAQFFCKKFALMGGL